MGALRPSMFKRQKPPRAGRPAWKCAEEFKRWLRKLPCARCEQYASPTNAVIAAHVDHAGGKGMATKVADQHCIALCNACHIEQHRIGWPSFEKLLPLGDAVALSSIYWTEWPGRREWEADLAVAGAGRGR